MRIASIVLLSCFFMPLAAKADSGLVCEDLFASNGLPTYEVDLFVRGLAAGVVLYEPKFSFGDLAAAIARHCQINREDTIETALARAAVSLDVRDSDAGQAHPDNQPITVTRMVQSGSRQRVTVQFANLTGETVDVIYASCSSYAKDGLGLDSSYISFRNIDPARRALETFHTDAETETVECRLVQ